MYSGRIFSAFDPDCNFTAFPWKTVNKASDFVRKVFALFMFYFSQATRDIYTVISDEYIFITCNLRFDYNVYLLPLNDVTPVVLTRSLVLCRMLFKEKIKQSAAVCLKLKPRELRQNLNKIWKLVNTLTGNLLTYFPDVKNMKKKAF